MPPPPPRRLRALCRGDLPPLTTSAIEKCLRLSSPKAVYAPWSVPRWPNIEDIQKTSQRTWNTWAAKTGLGFRATAEGRNILDIICRGLPLPQPPPGANKRRKTCSRPSTLRLPPDYC